MIRRILTVAAFLGLLATVSSCTKETENDPVTINAKDEVNVSVLAGKIVTVDFRTNGIAGAETPATISVANGDKIKLPKLTLGTEDDKILVHKGWSDGTNFYEPEKEYDVTGNTVFNAVWAVKAVKDQESLEKMLDYISNIHSDEPIEIALEGSIDPSDLQYISNAIIKASSRQKLSLNLSKLDWKEVYIPAYYQEGEFDIVANKLCGLVLPELATSVNIYGTDIKEITIPKYVTTVYLGEDHFYNGNLELSFENKISTVKFDGVLCNSVDINGLDELESIDLPTSVRNIDITDCSKLKSLDASYANELRVNSCTALENVVLDRGIKSIIQFAFKETALKSIVIPETVTRIEYYAFYNCKSLQSIVIPSSVTNIDYGVFKGCESLTSIEVKVKTEPYYVEDKKTELISQIPSVDPSIFGSAPLTQYDAEKEEAFKKDNLKITFTKPDGKKAKKSELESPDVSTEVINAYTSWRNAVKNVFPLEKDNPTEEEMKAYEELIDGHFDFEAEDEKKAK